MFFRNFELLKNISSRELSILTSYELLDFFLSFNLRNIDKFFLVHFCRSNCSNSIFNRNQIFFFIELTWQLYLPRSLFFPSYPCHRRGFSPLKAKRQRFETFVWGGREPSVIKLRPQTTSEASRKAPRRVRLQPATLPLSLPPSSSYLFFFPPAVYHPRIYHNLRMLSDDQSFTDFIHPSKTFNTKCTFHCLPPRVALLVSQWSHHFHRCRWLWQW